MRPMACTNFMMSPCCWSMYITRRLWSRIRLPACRDTLVAPAAFRISASISPELKPFRTWNLLTASRRAITPPRTSRERPVISPTRQGLGIRPASKRRRPSDSIRSRTSSIAEAARLGSLSIIAMIRRR